MKTMNILTPLVAAALLSIAVCSDAAADVAIKPPPINEQTHPATQYSGLLRGSHWAHEHCFCRVDAPPRKLISAADLDSVAMGRKGLEVAMVAVDFGRLTSLTPDGDLYALWLATSMSYQELVGALSVAMVQADSPVSSFSSWVKANVEGRGNPSWSDLIAKLELAESRLLGRGVVEKDRVRIAYQLLRNAIDSARLGMDMSPAFADVVLSNDLLGQLISDAALEAMLHQKGTVLDKTFDFIFEALAPISGTHAMRAVKVRSRYGAFSSNELLGFAKFAGIDVTAMLKKQIDFLNNSGNI